jgi:hypothetical protein
LLLRATEVLVKDFKHAIVTGQSMGATFLNL